MTDKKIWIPLASYGLKRENAPAQYSWIPLGTIMYCASEHSCAVVTDIKAYGTFYAKPYKQGDNLPFLQGDIKVFNTEWDDGQKKKYDHIGKILTHSDDGSGEISYQVELWGVSQASEMAKLKRAIEKQDFRPGLWQPVHLEDRKAYEPKQKPESKPEIPVWDGPEKGDAYEKPDKAEGECPEELLPF